MSGGFVKKDGQVEANGPVVLTQDERDFIADMQARENLALVRLLRGRDRLPAIGAGADVPSRSPGQEDCSPSCPDQESPPVSSVQPGSPVDSNGESSSVTQMVDEAFADLEKTKRSPRSSLKGRGAA
jgi:hypothetical protein